MLRSKKGFTLVELLAVIVILAIILAIAVPGISGIINNAKKGAFESDAKMIVTGIEYRVLEASVDPNITAPTVGTITDVSVYGADPANYDSVSITSMNPITIAVTSATDSKFGAWTATATKNTVTFGTTP